MSTNGEIKDKASCLNFDHLTFWVSNAKQAASYHCVHLGFEPLAYIGLETGSRSLSSHVIRSKDIILVFTSNIFPESNPEISQHVATHGDSIKDVAFTVDNIESIISHAVKYGASIVTPITILEDKLGVVKIATIATLGGDVTHTFVERGTFGGNFLPGFQKSPLKIQTMLKNLPRTNLSHIDHVVSTQLEDTIGDTSKWYQDILSFHRFWSVDDTIDVTTEISALKFVVVSNSNENIKLNILEPAIGRKISQVQEFNDFNGGPGIQHVAMHTNDIISTVRNLRSRGIEFLEVPKNYYDMLKDRLSKSKVIIDEDLSELQSQSILLDFDSSGYLLQIFTKPMSDRPTLFFEIIQRNGHNGFGAGNFKALFRAVEMEQQLRGNLN